jgi:hypothetical protein
MPALATICTLQVPSNLSGLARAEPDRITLVVREIAARVRFSIDEFSSRNGK